MFLFGPCTDLSPFPRACTIGLSSCTIGLSLCFSLRLDDDNDEDAFESQEKWQEAVEPLTCLANIATTKGNLSRAVSMWFKVADCHLRRRKSPEAREALRQIFAITPQVEWIYDCDDSMVAFLQ